MSIKCGNCRGRHGSVAEVRVCYQNAGVSVEQEHAVQKITTYFDREEQAAEAVLAVPAQNEKFDAILDLEWTVRMDKAALTFNGEAPGLASAQARLNAAIDALTPQEMTAYGEYRQRELMGRRPETSKAEDAPAPKPAPQVEVTGELRPGYFVVRFDDDTHMTFRITRQDEDDKFMPGRLLVAYEYGPDNVHDYQRFGHVKDGRLVIWKKHRDSARLVEAVKVLVGDPHAAQKAFVQESGNCARCDKLLTASAGEIYGPKCKKIVEGGGE